MFVGVGGRMGGEGDAWWVVNGGEDKINVGRSGGEESKRRVVQ